MDLDEPDSDPPRGSLLKQMRVTSFSGRDVTIPMFTQMPPYFDRPMRFDVKWVPNVPLENPKADVTTSTPLAEKYAARQYGDLISDEQSNRLVLDWLRNVKSGKSLIQSTKKKWKKRGEEATAAAELSHILLLAGPPGTGKSTLIRVVAAVCGFHVVEINASEDVSSDRNRLLLNNQIDFKPVFGRKTKPLLVLEEMDGIGTLSDSVMKVVTGNQRRPVIIIVNDAYATALRSIRQHAHLVRVPPPLMSRFVQRLTRICEMEGIDVAPGALAEIAEISRCDMRTALNTLQFLAMKQPVTIEMVHLVPVGVKNAALTPFDMWQAMFTQSTKMDDLMAMMESFGDNSLLAAGVLENCENVRMMDQTGHRIADVLDGLCFADCAYGEIGALGMADVPRLHSWSKIGKRQLVFPTTIFGKEAQIRKSTQIVARNPWLRRNTGLLDLYANPSVQTSNVLCGRSTLELKERFVMFHKMIKLSYKKNSFGGFQAEPDIDVFIDFYGNGTSGLSKFREMIQRELDREQVDVMRLTADTSIAQKTRGRTKKRKPSVATDFWGQQVPMSLPAPVEDRRADLHYKYNEGFTNAVKRRVYLNRILLVS